MTSNNGILIVGDCVFLKKALIEIVDEIEGKDRCDFYTASEINKSPAKKIRLRGVFVFNDTCALTERVVFLLSSISKEKPHVFFVFFTKKNIKTYNNSLQVSSNTTIFSLKSPINHVKKHLRLRLRDRRVFLDIYNIFNKVSKRQIEILSLRLAELSFKEMSVILNISYKTVMAHRVVMVRELGIPRLHDFNYFLKVIEIVDNVGFDEIMGRINSIRSKYIKTYGNENLDRDIKLVAPVPRKMPTPLGKIKITRLFSVCVASQEKEYAKFSSRSEHGTDFSR